ncbi:MAG: SPFH domain-containing protein [Opitutaceae bacterium]|jgi:membrane protease subunit (stomatin/prohibitin family)|nr:SPFH domain-containing protein [Opitutaceae bacterium]
MALFWKKEGGLMDVIRCDEPSYLIWKWRPAGADGAATRKENAIRWGSSLRVKDGEVAVFVYRQKDGTQQDFIEGPFDETIKTANFPVLASVVGLAFGGGTPFQAEVYFINLAGVIQVKFGVPYFDVFDPRGEDFAVPVAVRGTISFKIADYKAFIRLHRLVEFNLGSFQEQIRDAVNKYVKGVVANIPKENGIPVMQLDRKILQINEIVDGHIKPRLADDFGVTVKAVDIGTIDVDKTSEGYASLMSVTRDIAAQTTRAQAAVNIKNMADMQAINAGNMQETLRVQREELQHAQRMQTDSASFAVHQLNQQASVARAGAAALGQMGAGGAMSMGGGGAGGGMNPAAMMTGMAMGGAMGGQMAGMMNNMMQGMNQPGVPPAPGAGMMPPPVPGGALFNVASNGQSLGPFDTSALAQLARNGQLTAQTQVWKQGMAAWAAAGAVPELAGLFAPPPPFAQPPPPPPPPPPPAPPPVPAQ